MQDGVWMLEGNKGMGKVKLVHDLWVLFLIVRWQKLLWVSSLLSILLNINAKMFLHKTYAIQLKKRKIILNYINMMYSYNTNIVKEKY